MLLSKIKKVITNTTSFKSKSFIWNLFDNWKLERSLKFFQIQIQIFSLNISHFAKRGQVEKANDKNVIKYRLGFNVPKERVRQI
jgi:hypothetical protein